MVLTRFKSRRVSEAAPRSESARDRLLDLGAQALTSAELLTIVTDVAPAAADELLKKHGASLRRVALTPPAALTSVSTFGLSRAVRVHAALELGRRMTAETREDGTPIRAPRDVMEICHRMGDLPVEEFHVLVLDAQHRLERDVTVTRGILNSSLVHPREVFREAIAERAAALILVHNHPSGDPTPSADDRAVTTQLVEAGRLLDIPVHDHIIIGRGRYTSFAESGLL